jgi:hypothetical protein
MAFTTTAFIVRFCASRHPDNAFFKQSCKYEIVGIPGPAKPINEFLLGFHINEPSMKTRIWSKGQKCTSYISFSSMVENWKTFSKGLWRRIAVCADDF